MLKCLLCMIGIHNWYNMNTKPESCVCLRCGRTKWKNYKGKVFHN